jgi:hypothetical protein
LAWLKPINNDNIVAKCTSVWPKPKPINNANIVAKGTSVWMKPMHEIGVTKGKLVCPQPKPISNDNGGAKPFSTSANRINNDNNKPTSANHYDSGGGSANRINTDNDNGAKPTSHYGCVSGGSANRIDNDNGGAKPTSAEQLNNGGGADYSYAAGDNTIGDSTDIDAYLPFGVMKTDAPPELNIISNNSWVDEEARIRSRGALSMHLLVTSI